MTMLNIIVFIVCAIVSSTAFNLSPNPNINMNQPMLKTFMNKTRSSYFGYSINLRKKTLLIGAPRAQSNLETQRKIDEAGVIYKCDLNDEKSCFPYHFDTAGNTFIENTELAYNSEKKDFQMLGASMDGHGSEESRFVVCAPKLIGNVEEANHYLLHGICYWVTDTESPQPSGVRSIIPLRQKSLQTIASVNDLQHYYYIYGQEGFSVHVTDNNEEILIGAPGVYNWRGTVIRYVLRKRLDLNSLSRRSNTQSHLIKKRQTYEYRSEIPNPFYTSIPDDSYFGYAVSSANFLGPMFTQLYYVASAPQANQQTGEVYIFDIEDHESQKKIKVFNKFSGDQMGEYFGYAILTEDFNNDGLPDLAVAAPFYSKTGVYENGAVYVFLNTGNLGFERQPLITNDYEFNGRFGTVLGKIGDINMDGYKDIAISSPFEENGAVYIHLGGPNGISQKPSQKLQAPLELPTAYEYGSAMFGHSISRGVDIDNNGYNDIAIGAPNSEMVYVYKSYPVVNVIATIVPSKNEISIDDAKFKIKLCANYESKTIVENEIDFSMVISVDMKLNRASLSATEHSKTISDVYKLTDLENCWEFEIFTKSTLADIFKPIEIEMKYELVQKIPDGGSEFCTTCVLIDPNASKTIVTKVPFITGCKGERCMSDLKLVGTLINVKQPYVLGSTKTIAVQYEISNAGETAYLTQLMVTIPTNLTQFSRVPPNCKLNNLESLMTCDISGGKPLAQNDQITLTINLDASRLQGSSFMINASVSSTGDELNPSNNQYLNEVFMTEFSDIEMVGQSSSAQLSIEDGLRVENMSYSYKIFNNGPSTVKEMIVSIMVPITYLPSPNYHIDIVNFNEIEIRGVYTNRALDVTWYKDNKIVLQSSEESTQSSKVVENMNSNGFDSGKLGFDYDFNSEKNVVQELHDSNQHRRRRSVWQESRDEDTVFRVFNQYTHSVDEYQASYRISSDQEDQTIKNLPKNRTIFFDCSSPEGNGECIEAQFTVYNFRPGSEPIVINMNFTIDLQKIDQFFDEKLNIFLFKTNTRLQRAGDEELRTLKVSVKNPYTIIYEKLTTETPIWIYAVSTLAGILLLVLLCYTLYRLGFFKRTHKEEMERITRQSTHITSEDAEELKNLNV
ncbi:unnamed protein product [Diamesa hyperborea]